MSPSRKPTQLIAALILSAGTAFASAGTEQEAARLANEGQFGRAATTYRELVAKNPNSLRLRLELADALAKDRQWHAAIAEYQAALKLSPNNAEAWRGIGTVRRWQGHVDESIAAFEKARTIEPKYPSATLGLAQTYALDHDHANARRLYDEAAGKWPDDASVKRDAYDFTRQTRPRVYAFYEDDLSFTTKQGGAALPLLSREELGFEYQEETRVQPQTGVSSYVRTDAKVLYTHFFGLDHTIEASARSSEYEYAQPIATLGFTAIDTYEEYRVRYTFPLIPEQVVAVRYTGRPTTLVSGYDFNAHKLELELRSRWTPWLRTELGSGWLRDLDANATAANPRLANETLAKLGVQVAVTSRFDVGLKYITNPDLDSSINSTTLAEANYAFGGAFAGIARIRHDDYKDTGDQDAYYVGVRFVPNAHLWSEFGMKYVKRGGTSSVNPTPPPAFTVTRDSDGTYPLISLIWRF